MHPIERLRHVARAEASGADVIEAAARALSGLDGDHAALVTGCRRMVARHPTAGPMWWLTSRMLCAEDPRREAQDALGALDADRTPRAVADALDPDAVIVVLGWPALAAGALHRRGDVRVLAVDAGGEGAALADVLADAGLDARVVPTSGLGAAVAAADGVVLEALAAGPSGLVSVAGGRAAAAVARHAAKKVWAVAGEGRVVPPRLWETVLAAMEARGDAWCCAEEVVPLDLVDAVVGPRGMATPTEALNRSDCPVAAELLKEAGAPGTYGRRPEGGATRRRRGRRPPGG